ncbi:hypothetical protein K2173_023059 [Erythroxylum novogranatense]|uniref:Uncharacterized protein n=1 Tax=Erythroxylum novogranatense TaxID=1862640 RepID=A0AAV8T9P9_9ROSI|nr:hypothetical protein K2173_023059 [Erythroxylum novogranatense]
MGCCISKSRPKKQFIEERNHVQDKLVISQAPKLTKTPVPTSNKISPSPPSPSNSTSSAPSFTCTNISKTTTAASTTTTSSSVSSQSSGSLVFSSKDRPFSDEFLWSCVKENPHVIRINSIKERSQLLMSPVQQVVPPTKQSFPTRVIGPIPQQRARQNSPPTLTRQKSFRREPERLGYSSYSQPCRTLRSLSPSRRFNGEYSWGIQPKEISSSKRFAGSKVSPGTNSITSSLRRENLRLASPYFDSSRMRNRETCIHRVSSKIDEIAVEAALDQNGADSSSVEDIDNPLISLDCFIFL